MAISVSADPTLVNASFPGKDDGVKAARGARPLDCEVIQCGRRVSRVRRDLRATRGPLNVAVRSARLAGSATELPSEQYDIGRLPPQRTVKGLCVMPDVRNQDTAASPSELGLYSFDEIPADAPASRPLRDDQLAQVGSEAQVVGTDKASDRGVVLPDQRQVTRGLDTFRQRRIRPIALPKPGFRLHQPANGRKILASGFSNHALHPSHVLITPALTSRSGQRELPEAWLRLDPQWAP